MTIMTMIMMITNNTTLQKSPNGIEILQRLVTVLPLTMSKAYIS